MSSRGEKKADVHHRLAAMASPVAYIKELRQKMKHIDAFLISTEAWLLQYQWEDDVPHPRGRARFEEPQWSAYIQQQIDIKNHSLVDPEVTFDVYRAWCLGGNGDKMFQNESSCAENLRSK